MSEMAARLRDLQAVQQQIVAVTQQIQDVMLFGDHPELTDLDDELDILYRGQL